MNHSCGGSSLETEVYCCQRVKATVKILLALGEYDNTPDVTTNYDQITKSADAEDDVLLYAEARSSKLVTPARNQAPIQAS